MSLDKELSRIVEGASHIEKLGFEAGYKVHSKKAGPKVVIFGIIHGDEKCGFYAIKNLLQEFAARDLELTCGELTFALGNLRAFDSNERYTEENLNRVFRDNLPDAPTNYERERAKILRSLLRGVDFFLDLHATTQASDPFLMCEPHLIDDARRIGAAKIVTGWGTLGDGSVAGDTETYALSHGAKAFTMENGHLAWEGGAQCAYDTSIGFLRYAGVITNVAAAALPSSQIFHLTRVQTYERPGFKYSKSFKTFDLLRAGELIGTDDTKEFRAAEACTIIMPALPDKKKPGEDLFLIAGLPRVLGNT